MFTLSDFTRQAAADRRRRLQCEADGIRLPRSAARRLRGRRTRPEWWPARPALPQGAAP